MPRPNLPALVLLLTGLPGLAGAQVSEARAQAALEVSLLQTTVRGSAATLAGAAGLMSLGGRFAVGAGGALMLGSSTVETVGAGSDLELRVGYAGLLLHARLLGGADRYLAVRALMGAGNAKLRLPLVGPELAADNFGVLEPEVTAGLSLAGPLQVGLGAGYRYVFGVDDLPNVVGRDLEGFSVRARLSVHTRE